MNASKLVSNIGSSTSDIAHRVADGTGDLASRLVDNGGDLAKHLGANGADLAKRLGIGGADLAIAIGGGTAAFAKRIGAKRGLVGLAVFGGAIAGGIFLVRYLKRRAAEAESLEASEEEGHRPNRKKGGSNGQNRKAAQEAVTY